MENINMLEYVEELMNAGISEELACREYDATFNSNYNPDDYDEY